MKHTTLLPARLLLLLLGLRGIVKLRGKATQRKAKQINKIYKWRYYYNLCATTSNLPSPLIGTINPYIYIKNPVMLDTIVQLGIEWQRWWYEWRELYTARLLRRHAK